MRPDVHALTGAYAVNALSQHEQAQFEQHLEECPTCAEEVRELRETAARLGGAVAMTPPPAMRDRVLDTIVNVRQIPPAAPLVPIQRRRPLVRLAQIAAALVLLGAIGGLGALVLQRQNDLDRLEATAAQIAEVITAPDARTVVSGDGTTRATAVVSDERGAAVFAATGLSGAAGDEVYQLWVIGPDGAESAGLLTTRPDGSSEAVIAAPLGDGESLGVTVEPSGGSEQPTSDPIVLVPL